MKTKFFNDILYDILAETRLIWNKLIIKKHFNLKEVGIDKDYLESNLTAIG